MIFDLQKIKQNISLDQDLELLIKSQKAAFIDFSNGQYQIPFPLQLSFPENSGDCHVKAGFRNNGETFAIKVASGFYNNSEIGLPHSGGAILIMSQKTGLLQTILLDEGYLTTLRTALAALVALSTTPWDIKNIGIIGTGSLANLIQILIKKQHNKANLRIFGRNLNKAYKIADENVQVCPSVSQLVSQSDIVISTTASMEPIIMASDISGKKHIIALGADDEYKQECDPKLFKLADMVIVDSKLQASKIGDTSHALKAGFLDLEKIVELGKVLQTPLPLDSKMIITDSTGIAAQDVAIADFMMSKLSSSLKISFP